MTWKPLMLISFGALSASAHALDSCSARSGPAFKPLVELYTSEGCSSCPPADRWLSTQTGREDINLLAFHVDYWDAIGWPDRFASPAYSQRQRQRVQAAGANSVYTPQVMVGASTTVSWRSRGSFNAALATESGASRPELVLELEEGKSASEVKLSTASAGSADRSAQVWLAQYIDGQTSEVRAGENRGATLHHDRVVQKLWGPWPLGKTHMQALTIPNSPWGLVAFVQDGQGQTLQSLALPASACTSILNHSKKVL